MLRIEFVFAILFLAIGPLRTIPVFHAVTRDADWRFRLRAAGYATVIAGAIIAAVALVGVRTIENWGVSAAALEVAIGVLLLQASFAALSTLNPAHACALEHASTQGGVRRRRRRRSPIRRSPPRPSSPRPAS